MPIYRILAFFQKYDILGRFHTDVLLDDLFAGFASDCANFAEIQSDALLQEDISGYKSTSTFGGATETIEINHSINPIVYADVFGDFHSPVLLAHKAEGLSADAKFGKYDSIINLSSDFKGLQSAAKFGGSDSAVVLPSHTDGFVSTPAYGAADESIVGDLSVKDFISSAVFGESDETVELQSSIKATVISPVPTTTILAGTYTGNTSVTLLSYDIDINVPISYTLSGAVKHASFIGVSAGGNYTIFWAWRDREQGDVDLIGGVDLTSYNVDLNLINDEFTVPNDTTVSSAEALVFFQYFHLI